MKLLYLSIKIILFINFILLLQLEEYKHTAAQKRMRLPKITKTVNEREKASPKTFSSGDRSYHSNLEDKAHARTPSSSNQKFLEPLKVTPRIRM